MIISVAVPKGGSGKTTTAMYLAHCAYDHGYDVQVIDLDKQGSALSWAEELNDMDRPVPFPVNYSPKNTLRENATNSRAITFIDCPPGDTDRMDVAIESSDLVIIPTRPSQEDLKKAMQLSGTLTNELNIANGILITQNVSRSSDYRVILNLLKINKLPHFDEVVNFSHLFQQNRSFTEKKKRMYRPVWASIEKAMKASLPAKTRRKRRSSLL